MASRTAEVRELGTTTRRRIDVKPFFRDGAFLVAVFVGGIPVEGGIPVG